MDKREQAIRFAEVNAELVLLIAAAIEMGREQVLSELAEDGLTPAAAIPYVANPGASVGTESAAQEVFGGSSKVAPPAGVCTPTNPAPTLPDTRTTQAEVDSANQPWDARIHASTRTKVQKTGVWKLKRGIDPKLVAQVEEEHRNRIPGVQGGGLVPTPETKPEPEESLESALGTPPAAAGTPEPEPEITYAVLMKEIVQRTGAGDYTPAQVWEALAKFGIAGTGDLADATSQFGAIWKALKALYVPAA